MPELPLQEKVNKRALASAKVCFILGLLLVVGGVAVMWWPAAVVLAGVGMIAYGLIGINVSTIQLRKER